MIAARVVSPEKTRNGIPGNNSSQRARADIARNINIYVINPYQRILAVNYRPIPASACPLNPSREAREFISPG